MAPHRIVRRIARYERFGRIRIVLPIRRPKKIVLSNTGVHCVGTRDTPTVTVWAWGPQIALARVMLPSHNNHLAGPDPTPINCAHPLLCLAAPSATAQGTRVRTPLPSHSLCPLATLALPLRLSPAGSTTQNDCANKSACCRTGLFGARGRPSVRALWTPACS